MKGEYIGQDGRNYRWERGEKTDQFYLKRQYGEDWCWHAICPADWPAAKAALDELIAEEAEWVEILGHHRIKRDGTCPQVRPPSENWRSDESGYPWVGAFRAGLQVRDENVRALMKWIYEIDRWAHDCSPFTLEHIHDSVHDLARKVQL